MAQGYPGFTNCLLMRHEADSFLEWFVNKQNCRCGAPEFPRAFHERPAYSENVAVWGAVGTVDVMGPCFFKRGGEAAG
jgi:hypothetical protein